MQNLQAEKRSPKRCLPLPAPWSSLLFEQMDAAVGLWGIELFARGKLERAFRHETLSANELERFDATTIYAGSDLRLT